MMDSKKYIAVRHTITKARSFNSITEPFRICQYILAPLAKTRYSKKLINDKAIAWPIMLVFLLSLMIIPAIKKITQQTNKAYKNALSAK